MSVSFDDFQKINLKIGKILEAVQVDGSETLLKMKVDFGSIESANDEAKIPDTRQVIAGIGKAYKPEELIGREFLFIANLEPRTIMGLESQGMILAASDENGPVILSPDREVPPGADLH